jgi:Tol biopolymer transport system component
VTSRTGDEIGEFALSRDGKSLALADLVDGGLYYWNLATGKEREVLRDNNVEGVIFGPDAMTLMFSVDDPHILAYGIYEMPALGGATKKIWNESAADVGLWDSAPDGTVLFVPFSKPRDPGRVFEMDMKSLSTTTFLDDPDYDVWQAHFSHDGRWVTFIAAPKGHDERGSEVFVVPFRKALTPRSEWVPITAGRGGDKPRFSWDDKLIFFSSERDGFRCIWAQGLGQGERPVGEPFAVQHFHQRRRSLSNLDIGQFQMAVGPKMIVFNQAEINSNIWVLNPGKAAK